MNSTLLFIWDPEAKRLTKRKLGVPLEPSAQGTDARQADRLDQLAASHTAVN
jgi:hypothetical protein